jgi:hypothetical protein
MKRGDLLEGTLRVYEILDLLEEKLSPDLVSQSIEIKPLRDPVLHRRAQSVRMPASRPKGSETMILEALPAPLGL